MSNVTNNSAMSWIPPDPSVLSFTNASCKLASSWLASWYKLRNEDLPVNATTLLLRDGLEMWLRNDTSHRAPDIQEALAWVMDPQSIQVIVRMYSFTTQECNRMFCSQIGWKGNPDLAGRGMLASYIIQAALTTIYVFALGAMRIRRLSPSKEDNPVAYKFTETAKHSSRPFLDTSMLFSIVMLVAAITTFSRGLTRAASDGPTTTLYTSVTTSLLSLYSILPSLLLQTCASPDLRRTKWRRVGWITIALLGIAVVVLYSFTPLLPSDTTAVKDEETRNQLVYEFGCSNWDLSWTFKNLIWVLVGCLGSFSTAYLALEFARRRTRARIIKSLRDKWWWIIASLGLVAMWTCLGLFIYFRATFQDQNGNGNDDSDQRKGGGDYEWTFGQILALGTWAPIFVEAGYVLLEGPKRALTGLMVDPWEAVSTAEMGEGGKEDPENSNVELHAYEEASGQESDEEIGERDFARLSAVDVSGGSQNPH